MVIFHEQKELDLNLEPYFQNHSADEIVSYKQVSGEDVTMGIFYPPERDKTKKYPLFVFIHGGGWASHTIFPDQPRWAGDHLGFLARYYARKGYVAVSVDYRLLRDNGQEEHYGLIDLYGDCLDAVLYLKEHADGYGLDFDDSVILGESAGGWLAAALAAFDFREKPLFPRAILVNAITDLTDLHWNRAVPSVTENEYLKHLCREERTAFLSPVRYIKETTCPTLLIHGAADSCVRPRHSVAFHDEMEAAGRDCQLHFIKNTDHAFLLAEYYRDKGWSLDCAKTAIGIMDRWLEK